MWAKQFTALRDGDRFFYGNQLGTLTAIKNAYGIDFRKNLGDLIAQNTDIPRADMPVNVFFLNGEVPPTACTVKYTVSGQTGTDAGTFAAHLKITNTGTQRLDNWTLRYRYLSGQKVTTAANAQIRQFGTDVPVRNVDANASLAPGQSAEVDLTAAWTGANPSPDAFTLNTKSCTLG
jgi:hypothetical protein